MEVHFMSIKVVSDTTYQDLISSSQKGNPTSTQNSISDINKEALASLGVGEGNLQNNNPGQQLANPQKQLESEINKANNQLHFKRTRCEFKYFDDINRVAIKVIDKNTDEVIREIPPEDTIELIQKLWEFAGLLYDEKG